MTGIPPLYYRWDGEALIPLTPRHADKHLTVGECYRMVTHEERSAASHRQYFASLHEAWMNLPEEEADRFPTSEHLRKRALVEAGYFDEEIIDCGSNKVAPNVGAAIRKRDDFAVIFIRDQFVIVRSAKSQSMRAMGKAVFQKSKDAVLDIAWGLCGMKASEAKQHVGKAA
jgi:hypothetical protein